MTDELKDAAIPAQPATSARPDPANRPLTGYEAEAAALRAKTERLRALRLAREAAAPPAPPKRTTAKGSAKRQAKSAAPATLSAWLDEQQKSGRRT